MPTRCSFNTKTQPTRIIEITELAIINNRIAAGDTFVVNIVAAWCSDCTEKQALHINTFTQIINSHNIDVLQITVQLIKGVFISLEHEKITTFFGGHGYPRTVLIKEGYLADNKNVEVVTKDALSELANKFIQIITKP